MILCVSVEVFLLWRHMSLNGHTTVGLSIPQTFPWFQFLVTMSRAAGTNQTQVCASMFSFTLGKFLGVRLLGRLVHNA